MRPSFSLGIEEEYQTIDPVSRDLRSHIQTEMLAHGKLRLQERVKAEMHTSVVEVGTRVCRNIDEARTDIYELRREMIKLAKDHGLVLVAGATHPFADCAHRRSTLTPATTRWSRTCNWWPAPTSSSACMCMWALRTARQPSAS